jgi:hypothetical protein
MIGVLVSNDQKIEAPDSSPLQIWHNILVAGPSGACID